MKSFWPSLTRRDIVKAVPLSAVAWLLAACGLGTDPATLQPTVTSVAGSPEPAARRFLDAWQRGDFDAMYALLSSATQTAISREAFEQRYLAIAAEATVYEFATSLVSAGMLDPAHAAADFDVVYKTRLVGDLSFRPRLRFVMEADSWRLEWSPAMIIPSLGQDNRLRLFARTSTRGVIYDRNGEVMATQGAIVQLGVVPGQIKDEGAVQALLSELLGKTPGEIKERYTGQPAEWFVPIGEVAFETAQGRYDQLSTTSGIAMRERATRTYAAGAVAAHMIGYTGPISAEELTALGERGYEEQDRVGKLGLEKWGEPVLAGKKGGRLSVLTPQGQEVETLADQPAVQSRSLTLTLDLALQRACEEILGERLGSIVVLDAATSRVLAMASWPRYDPNAMSNELDAEQRLAIANQPGQPLLNRATQGVYPPGSVFKIVTMAAGLQQGGFATGSPFSCPGFWNKLNILMRCWKANGHSAIDLFHGLVESCDVVFYEIGLALYRAGGEGTQELLQEMARAFGLGKTTGIELDESAGLVPDNAWKTAQIGTGWTPGDTVNMSIGQGYLQTSSLQVANYTAAVANGGTIFRPSLVLRSADVTGSEPPEEFQPELVGTLPVAPEYLEQIRQAMVAVTVPPNGTASESFGNFPIKVAGKTGTAEAGPGRDPHAWFTAFAPADKPEIAVCAMFENAGEGSQVAAPAVKAVMERYFKLA